MILGGCTEDKLRGKPEPPIVIDQAVDFLQALFDLLTKVHIHLEVCTHINLYRDDILDVYIYYLAMDTGTCIGIYSVHVDYIIID